MTGRKATNKIAYNIEDLSVIQVNRFVQISVTADR